MLNLMLNLICSSPEVSSPRGSSLEVTSLEAPCFLEMPRKASSPKAASLEDSSKCLPEALLPKASSFEASSQYLARFARPK